MTKHHNSTQQPLHQIGLALAFLLFLLLIAQAVQDVGQENQSRPYPGFSGTGPYGQPAWQQNGQHVDGQFIGNLREWKPVK